MTFIEWWRQNNGRVVMFGNRDRCSVERATMEVIWHLSVVNNLICISKTGAFNNNNWSPVSEGSDIFLHMVNKNYTITCETIFRLKKISMSILRFPSYFVQSFPVASIIRWKSYESIRYQPPKILFCPLNRKKCKMLDQHIFKISDESVMWRTTFLLEPPVNENQPKTSSWEFPDNTRV